jgi:hypothetical protein
VTTFPKKQQVDIADVRTKLGTRGWALATGTLDDVKAAIKWERTMALYSRSTTRKVKTSQLRPYTAEAAPPRSLSAVYGLSAQPLHTDGAHLLEPPHILVLHSAKPTPTGTALWKPGMGGGSRLLPEAVSEGVFTVRGNGVSFLASAHQDFVFRFDPVVMSPGDAMAKEAVAYFEKQRIKAFVHEWQEENQLLFIDNRRMLHAREAVEEDAGSRELARLDLNFVEEET